ncbi:RagB/SusD family nutrient uptake outer membrane protein [Olivibacter sitiensis]|uniref:RagB/SusD family nutrient uptake outer membrane protein n=1 Tax=Olivibacter sitiensis TaxID=376470 RepID=UPI000486EB6A|nr:RagB/SusD family nutrient uptake outer membrane protein [Olivibacter sitiensis]
MKRNIQITTLLVLLLVLFSGCEKFLEEKSDKSLSVPTTVEDFQSMLYNYAYLSNDFVSAGEVSSDDYYLMDADFNSLTYESDRRLYTWQPDYVTRPYSSAGDEWYNCYRAINTCNSILKGLEDNNLTGAKADNIKGQALVFRAARFMDGVQVWAPAYNRQTADADLGMVLRLDPDMNIPSIRSSVQQTYDLIINDLTQAIPLLPNEPSNKALPTIAAAHGLLARTYLYMGEYGKASQNAQDALRFTNAQVIDFNELEPNTDFPIPATNYASEEIILWSTLLTAHPLRQAIARIEPTLYNLYAEGDLRKVIYFRQNADDSYSFKGTHVGYFALMNSLTPAEMLLTIAECDARLGNLSNASKALNQLMIKRLKINDYTPYSFTDNQEALQIILGERRKELVMRGLRWPDIKRLNRDGHDIPLSRMVNGQTITLPPNDLRYAIAISENVIEIGRIQQNSR